MNPRVVKKDGLKHLDRVIQIVCRNLARNGYPLVLTFMQCAEYGIYTIIDLHAAPGGMQRYVEQFNRIVDCSKGKTLTGIQTTQLIKRCVSSKWRHAGKYPLTFIW